MNFKSRILQSLVDVAGVVILCGLFLYWDLSRILYVVTALIAVGYLLCVKPTFDRDYLYYSLPIYGFFGAMQIAKLPENLVKLRPKELKLQSC